MPANERPAEETAQPEEEVLQTAPELEFGLQYPGEFLLFLVPGADARTTHAKLRQSFREWLYDSELDEYLKAVVFHTKLAVNLLPNKELEDFYHFVENGVLSEPMQHRCFSSHMIVQLMAEGNDQLTFFAPFWAAMVAAWFYGGDLDAIVVDAYDSYAYPANIPFWQFHVEGVPLTHQFLAVTGFPQQHNNKMCLRTTGMKRFGLPELSLQNVNPEYAPDLAYLIRGVGQYMLCGIEKSIPASATLLLSDELDLPTNLCELDRSTAMGIAGALLPISLGCDAAQTSNAPLIIGPSLEFDTEEEWIEKMVWTIRRERLQIDVLSK